ncbi:class I SAM-dependent methyltransferase [Streptomyces sp. HNM0575]|uniref:class I SAM-dependent methyltransferase n=1 Tax=Streptomyces sp. HNM0575 TaxID=2716338 RepID=UPI00145D07D0|nr:class I SAM-dependent methyltransferase [Streptomyces sp. HNM0575]NLU71690.1 class I SAM-dependent methyltransferase [Streptomyces sp. HNM0575]
MDRDIRSVEDVLGLLDGLFEPEADRWTAAAAPWWDAFYANRAIDVPFFVPQPDENLVSYVERGLVTPGPGPGRALDLGCGPGRNAVRLSAVGFDVDAVDLSPTAIAWAAERAEEAGAKVRFVCGDVFAPGTAIEGPYDLIYDSGCFHHLPPHRRVSYLALLDRVLAPGGHLGLTCFAAGEGGTGCEIGDAELYRRPQPGLEGGLAYTPEALRRIFSGLTEVELRRMRDEPEGSLYFGQPFLWTALFRREPASAEVPGEEPGEAHGATRP